MKRSFLLLGLICIVLFSCDFSPAVSPTNSLLPNGSKTQAPIHILTPVPTGELQLSTSGAFRLTMSELKNTEYHSRDWGDFQLSDGIYYREPPPGESLQNYFTRLEGPIAYGDLNADGVEDSAVILRSRAGGTGAFADLAAVLNQGGHASNVSMVPLGDRVRVLTAQIQAEIIVLDMLVQGPNDGLCCPSQPAKWRFELKNDQLEQLP